MAKRKTSTAPGARSFKGIRGYYVASTHWDREWYETFQAYRFRLVDVMDRLIELMERDGDYHFYQLDGQSVVLEDYLEVRPERRERLQALFDAGRIEAGPWYVLPDEFLVCGESLVRNLMRGHRVAGEFTTPMKVGFACDLFGHTSQLPQIFRGFGMDTATVWRGTNFPTHPGLFRWQSPDGSEVLTYTFVAEGYGQYQFMVRDFAKTADLRLNTAKAVDGLRNLFAVETERVPGKAILLFDGVDHVPPEPDTSKLIARAAKAGLDIAHTRLADFFEDVRQQKLNLKLFVGELRAPGETRSQNVIPGVLSSRIYLKQRNAACEQLLLQWAEPSDAWAGLLGIERIPGYLDLAWKYLLRNHPHDSICGCSIDQVHRDMMYRFDQCRMIAERATHVSLRAIADQTALPTLEGEEDFAVSVFNPGDEALDGIVELPLYFRRDTTNRYQEWFGYEPIVGFRLHDAAGRELPYQRLGVQKKVPAPTWDARAGHRGGLFEQVNVAAKLSIPPRGWTTLLCRPTTDKTRSTGSQLVDDHTMENEFLRVRVNVNGTLDITDRRGGTTYHQALTFEERADIGDGWFHGTAVNDEWFTSRACAADVACVQDGFAQTTLRIRLVMHVPERFEHSPEAMQRAATLVPLEITSWVTLKAGQPWLEVRCEVENTARDHRLRVLFPTHLPVKQYAADGAYDVVWRDVALRADNHTLWEPEVETKPQATWTAVNDGKRGLAIIASGQPESSVRDLPDRPIALTLFRGFARTVGTAGEPDGQMLGRTSHRFWVYPHQGALPGPELCRLGQRLAGGVHCIYTDRSRLPLFKDKPRLPATGSWLRSGPGPLVITACKAAEDGQALIVRVFNPTDKAARQKLEFFTPVQSAHTADLLEQPQTSLAARGNSITVVAEGRQIVTLRVVLRRVV